MKPQMKVQTAMAADDRASRSSHRFSIHQKRSPDLSTQQQPSNQHSSGYSNHAILPFTPPPSPSPKNKLRYSQRNYTENRSTIHVLADELIDMYEQTVQQCTAAENRYKRLDLTMKSTLKLQTKTYEHCIEELNGRIEKLKGRSVQHLSTSSDFLSKFIECYATGFADDGGGNLLDLDRDNQMEALKQQILFTEQSAQHTIAHYLGQLEKERLESKQKDQIIAKQDNLITTLEAKIQKLTNQQHTIEASLPTSAPSKNEKLLEAQIALQAVELDDKKKLLAMLIYERDELFVKVEQLSQLKTDRPNLTHSSDSHSMDYTKKRSSIDLLAKIVQTDTSNSASTINMLQTTDSHNQKTSASPLPFKKSHVLKDHSPPPPSPPPKNPPPPTPRKLIKPPPRSVSTRKAKPRRLNVDQHQSGTKSWSGSDFETATDGNKASCYYIPPSSSLERPIYHSTQEPHAWRKRLAQELMSKSQEKVVNPPNDHANGFSSLLKNWKRHAYH